MNIVNACKKYFYGFNEISNIKKNDSRTNGLALLKILSYFTIIIPLAFATLYGAASLCGRVCKKQQISSLDKKVDLQAKSLVKPPLTSSSIIRESPLLEKPRVGVENTPIEVVHSYPGDLTVQEKASLEANFENKQTLKLSIDSHPESIFTIREQDLFQSGAQVIVNAANTHLGGGGGIDGAIHKIGGESYAEGHRSLKINYQSNYISGYAAIIESGLLKERYNIQNVIVVAGPQGKSSPQKEDQLYSCYYNSLILAHRMHKESIAFPSISTGIFGFPKDRAAAISLRAVVNFLNDNPDTSVKTISIHFLTTSGENNLEIYKNAASILPHPF